MPAQQPLQHIVARGVDVSHIVKDGKTEAFSQIGQANLGKTQFFTIDEERRAAHRKTRVRIARARLIQPETAERVATPGKKEFRQRDNGNVLAARGGQVGDLAGSGWKDASTAIALFQSNGGGTSEYKLMVGASEGVVGRILKESAAEIRLETNETRGGK